MKPSQKTASYRIFNPRDYLAEYYQSMGNENLFLLDFYHKAYASLPAVDSMLEVGGGPTIYQLLSAAQSKCSITFCDYLEANLKEVERWMSGHPDAFCWDHYIERAASLHGLPAGTVASNVKSAIRHLHFCNMIEDQPFPQAKDARFDLISSAFCLESITHEQEVFRAFFPKLKKRFAPGGGHLVLAMIKGCECYKSGRLFFPATRIDEGEMRSILRGEDFEILDLQIFDTEEKHGYDGIMGIIAKWEPPA